MLPKEARPLQPYAPVTESDLLGRSNEELVAIVQRYRDDNPNIKHPTRIRRAGPVVAAEVDRLPAPAASLAEHLSHQLRMSERDPRMVGLAEWIIWNLDADGYLREDLPRFAAMAGARAGELEQALAIVQALEPTGVGARSLSECLLLQLRAQADPDPVAIQLVDGHIKALAEKRYEELASTLRQSPERIVQALAAIRRLEPRPARPFEDVPAQTVRPDVAIVKAGDDYRVVLPDDGAAHVRVSRHRWAEAAAEQGEARAYLAQRLQVTSSLITALERRRQTVRARRQEHRSPSARLSRARSLSAPAALPSAGCRRRRRP